MVNGVSDFSPLYKIQKAGLAFVNAIDTLKPQSSDSLKSEQDKTANIMTNFQEYLKNHPYSSVRCLEHSVVIAYSSIASAVTKGVHALRLDTAPRYIFDSVVQSPPVRQMSHCAALARDYFFPVNVVNGSRSMRVHRTVIDILEICTYFSVFWNTSRSVNRTLAVELQTIVNNLKKDSSDLFSQSCQPDLERYNIELVASREVNAFAIPGGTMAFYQGLNALIDQYHNSLKTAKINCSTTEEDLEEIAVDVSNISKEDIQAAVIAHEMTHIAAGHAESGMLYSLFLSFVNAALFQEIARDYISREQEFEADLTSIYLLKKSGYNPLAALWLQEMFEQEYGTPFFSFTTWFSSHPTAAERKAAILGGISALEDSSLYLNGSNVSDTLSDATKEKSEIISNLCVSEILQSYAA